MELVEFGPDDAVRVAAFLGLTREADAADCPWEPEPVGTAVIDASEYDNLWNLRCSPSASRPHAGAAGTARRFCAGSSHSQRRWGDRFLGMDG